MDDLTLRDIETLIKGLDALLKEPGQTALTSSMVGVMLSPNKEQADVDRRCKRRSGNSSRHLKVTGLLACSL